MDKNLNIGVLIVCTGKYHIFFDSLYESCEKFFLKNHNKTYYVFTDGEIKESDNIKKINQPYMGFPNDTLKRFHLFNNISEQLVNEDYLFFLNANMFVVDDVTEDILPKSENNYLAAVNHPSFYDLDRNRFTYERRLESVFYIPFNTGNFYYQGCFNGGRSKEFLEMSKILSEMIDKDLENNITPIWWDESALNWYFLDKNPLVIHPQHAYPEGWSLPFNKKIVQRDKNKFGGHNFLRQV